MMVDDSGGYHPRSKLCILGCYVMRGGFLAILNTLVIFIFQ
jgi:hypothetical protein